VVSEVVVAGEALIDLVAGADGQVRAHLGGGPYNAARTMARLGAATTFFGRLAGDRFGRLLREQLTEDGVGIAVAEPSGRPSTLAVVAVDDAGIASYSFYLDGTSVADLDYPAAKRALPAGPTALHVGSLGLLMEPVGTATERLLADVPAGTLVLLDPNCRPGAVADRDAYRGRIDVFARRADIVKASTEDLAYLYPGLPSAEAATALLAAGPSLVLVTDGPHPARAFLPGAVLAEPVPAVPVADTIGAGDAFGGGFLAWWLAHDLRREDLRDPDRVGAALQAAAAVAALTCARPGADPPARADLLARNWWPAPPLPPAQ
jgi:fructokinase